MAKRKRYPLPFRTVFASIKKSLIVSGNFFVQSKLLIYTSYPPEYRTENQEQRTEIDFGLKKDYLLNLAQAYLYSLLSLLCSRQPFQAFNI